MASVENVQYDAQSTHLKDETINSNQCITASPLLILEGTSSIHQGTYIMKTITILIFSYILTKTEAACSSCLVSSLAAAGSKSAYHGMTANGSASIGIHQPHRHHRHVSKNFLSGNIQSTTKSALMYIFLSQLSTHFGCNVHDYRYRNHIDVHVPSPSVYPSSSSTATAGTAIMHTTTNHPKQKRRILQHFLPSLFIMKWQEATDAQNECR